MEISKFNEKFNRVDGKIYVVEEVVTPVEGVYEAELIHDNVNIKTINIYTGSKLTGDKINTYSPSTPSLAPWKTVIKIFSNISPLYISYETTGDTVEAEDINNLQDAVNETQQALNSEINRAKVSEKNISDNLLAETERAKNTEKSLNDNLNNEIIRSKNKENELLKAIENETKRASDTESKINTDLNTEITRAKNAESTENTRAVKKENEIESNLDKEIERATNSENSITKNLDTESNRAKKREEELNSNNNTTNNNLANEINRSTQAEKVLTDNLANEINRAKSSEKTISDNLISEIDRATNAEKVITDNLNSYKTSNDSEIQGLKAKDIDLDNKKANLDYVNLELNKRYTKEQTFTKDEILKKIQDLIGNAPGTLDTFREIADALGNDPNFATTIISKLSNKVDKITGKSLSTNDYDNIEKSKLADVNAKKHEHNNKGIIDKITQGLLDAWNSAYSHISDSIRHITSSERNLWNTVSNKTDKGHMHDDRYYTESEIETKLNSKANSSHTHIKSQITDMPTKLSQFNNDAGFITEKDVDTSQNHIHSNKGVLDKINQALLDSWNTIGNKSNNNHTHSSLDSKSLKSANELPSTWAVGMYMTEVYNNGFPCPYGNCLTLKSSSGAITQICMEWKGSDATIGSMWIRNKRDTAVDKFSDFREFSFSGHTHTKANITDMPTKLSQFSNDTGFIKKRMTWNELEGL